MGEGAAAHAADLPLLRRGDPGPCLCSFLALVLQKELAGLCRSHEVSVEWDDLIRDLDRLQEATIEKDGKRVTTRKPVSGQVGRVFQPPASPCRPTGANTPPDPHPPEM